VQIGDKKLTTVPVSYFFFFRQNNEKTLSNGNAVDTDHRMSVKSLNAAIKSLYCSS
jgi:hypothetical protein